TIRHERALRDATDDEQRAKENERHGDALAKENERHGDVVRKIADRAAEDKRTRDLAFNDAEARAAEQATKNAARIDAEYKKKVAALDAEDRAASETNARQDARAGASRTLTATRRAEDESTTEQRAEASRALQQTRESEDWTLRRTRAETDLKQSLTDIEEKRQADSAAIEARREKDITASNAALVAKQQQIDAARDADFGKFQADFARRLRDMEQQFGDSMGKLSSLVPERVASFTGRAAQNTASAAANLTAASAVTRAAVASESGASASTSEVTASSASAGSPAADGQTFGGQPQEVQELFAAVYGEDAAAVWQAEHEASTNRGQGAGSALSDAQDATFDTLTPASGLSAILARLNTALAVTNTLRGGDYRAASAPAVPPGVTLPRVTPKGPTGTPTGPESSVSWAMAQVGRQDYIGLCQKFVENANGTTGRYPSAVAAANALTTNAGGQMGDAPRGALVFFRPDASNGYFGHVGISLGGGQMVSGAANGVSVDGASRYWSSLYSGYGLPRFAQGVRDFTGGLAMVGEEGPELVKLPRGSNVYSAPETRQMMAPAPINLTLNVAGSVQTEQDLVRGIYNGLRNLERSGLRLGTN
ncbi:MAG TPA: NlpC/P60 family protein, partial [Chloroflexota bacterium]|nr:NlpC/P60 family protein [Chloroflexota bacterium]